MINLSVPFDISLKHFIFLDQAIMLTLKRAVKFFESVRTRPVTKLKDLHFYAPTELFSTKVSWSVT